MSDVDSIQIPGDYRAQKALVTTFSGQEIDIILHIDRIIIYEDLFTPFLTVELEIRDAIGLKNKIPLRGGEELITLSVTDSDGQFGLQDAIFSIYKMKDIVQVSDRAFVYRLCCVSIEAIKDMNLKLSKAYTGQASNLVHTLLVEEGLETNKSVFIEDTKNKISYISNYWSPIQNIKYISDRAVTRTGSSASCLFYETKQGFAFTSLNTLTSGVAVAQYQFGVGGLNNVARGLSRIEKIHIDTGFDYIERLASGAYGNRALLVDPYNKTYDFGYYDFVEAFAKQNHLNPQSFATDSVTRRLNSVFRSRVVPSRSFASMKTESSEQWFKQRLTELAGINAFNIQIEVAGRLDVVVGQVVEVFLYAGQISTDGASRKDMNEIIDRIYSGRYLITGICHAMDKQRHTMNLKLAKDSLMDNQ